MPCLSYMLTRSLDLTGREGQGDGSVNADMEGEMDQSSMTA